MGWITRMIFPNHFEALHNFFSMTAHTLLSVCEQRKRQILGKITLDTKRQAALKTYTYGSVSPVYLRGLRTTIWLARAHTFFCLLVSWNLRTMQFILLTHYNTSYTASEQRQLRPKQSFQLQHPLQGLPFVYAYSPSPSY